MHNRYKLGEIMFTTWKLLAYAKMKTLETYWSKQGFRGLEPFRANFNYSSIW